MAVLLVSSDCDARKDRLHDVSPISEMSTVTRRYNRTSPARSPSIQMAMIRQPVQSGFQSGFSRITQALSDPAREAIVSALAGGQAMPAGELAQLAGLSPQSASAHLQKLVDAKVLSVWPQGRFRYYRIADDDVAELIESLVNLATKREGAARARRLP